MRSKKVLVAAGFVAMWTFVTYYFLLRNYPDFLLNKRSLLKKLDSVEVGAQEEFEANDKIIQNLIGILKTKLESTIPPELNINNDDKDINMHRGARSHIKITALSKDNQLESAIKEISLNESPSKSSTTIVDIYTSDGQPIIPVLVFACNRVSINESLYYLTKYRTNKEQFPIIVSQVSSIFNCILVIV